MRTIVYKIKSCSDTAFIEQKLSDHAACTRFLYKKLDESADPNLLNYCKDRFKLTDMELYSIVAHTKQIRNSFNTKVKATKQEIVELQEDIADADPTLLFKLKHKLAKKQQFVKSDIVFGSRKLLSEISKSANNKTLTNLKKSDYVKRRLGRIFLIGEANAKGNRYFDFDLANKRIIYRPYRSKHVEFIICNRRDKFEKEIQQAINNKQLAITVSINAGTLTLSYDEATLCGFAINKFERKLEVANATKYCFSEEERKVVAKQVYKDYYDRLKQRQLADKLPNRFLGIDLNPDHIGYTIADKLPDNTMKTVVSGNFDFSKLTQKSGKSSESPKSIYANNKRKHERKEVVCMLFDLMKHYHVSHFIMEDLNFKPKNKIERREFNRKVKNIWDRNLLTSLILKKCTETGTILEKVNPIYTSLIGNLSYKVFDPVASSLEITRRGATKYNKGSFFPASTTHTTEAVATRCSIDAESIKDASWRQLSTIFKQSRYRWDEAVGKTAKFSMESCKSRVQHNLYCVVTT